MVEGVCGPGPEDLDVEEVAVLAERVEPRVAEQHVLGDVLVEDADDERWEGQEDDVVHGQCPGLDDGLAGEAVAEGEPELAHVEHDVLVEGVEDGLREPVVGPGAVHEEQLAEEPELAHGEVCSPGCLHSLEPADSHAHVCGLDHRDVVCPVADRQEDRVCLSLDEPDHEGLLQGRDPAAEHCFAA